MRGPRSRSRSRDRDRDVGVWRKKGPGCKGDDGDSRRRNSDKRDMGDSRKSDKGDSHKGDSQGTSDSYKGDRYCDWGDGYSYSKGHKWGIDSYKSDSYECESYKGDSWSGDSQKDSYKGDSWSVDSYTRDSPKGDSWSGESYKDGSYAITKSDSWSGDKDGSYASTKSDSWSGDKGDSYTSTKGDSWSGDSYYKKWDNYDYKGDNYKYNGDGEWVYVEKSGLSDHVQGGNGLGSRGSGGGSGYEFGSCHGSFTATGCGGCGMSMTAAVSKSASPPVFEPPPFAPPPVLAPLPLAPPMIAPGHRVIGPRPPLGPPPQKFIMESRVHASDYYGESAPVPKHMPVAKQPTQALPPAAWQPFQFDHLTR